jgi:hypothetical protein
MTGTTSFVPAGWPVSRAMARCRSGSVVVAVLALAGAVALLVALVVVEVESVLTNAVSWSVRWVDATWGVWMEARAGCAVAARARSVTVMRAIGMIATSAMRVRMAPPFVGRTKRLPLIGVGGQRPSHAVPGRRAGRLCSSWRSASGCAAGVVMPRIASWRHHSFLEGSPDRLALPTRLPQRCDEEGSTTVSILFSGPVEDLWMVLLSPGSQVLQPHRQECVGMSIAVLSAPVAASGKIGFEVRTCRGDYRLPG